MGNGLSDSLLPFREVGCCILDRLKEAESRMVLSGDQLEASVLVILSEVEAFYL